MNKKDAYYLYAAAEVDGLCNPDPQEFTAMMSATAQKSTLAEKNALIKTTMATGVQTRKAKISTFTKMQHGSDLIQSAQTSLDRMRSTMGSMRSSYVASYRTKGFYTSLRSYFPQQPPKPQ